MRLQHILLIVIVFLTTGSARASIIYASAGATYTQNFDSPALADTDHAWANDTTIAGWHLFRVVGSGDLTPVPIVSYNASNGDASAGRFYSFGSDSNPERALGAIGFGVFGDADTHTATVGFGQTLGWIAAGVQNNTGSTLTGFTLNYDGEQWRDAATEVQTMVFQYGFGETFATVPTWITPAGNFNFDSPQNTGAGAIDGNGIGRVANLGGSISTLTWQADSTLWLRWVEQNDVGSDHGLAIDNVSFSATSDTIVVPEGNAAIAGLLIFGLLGFAADGSTFRFRRLQNH